MVVIFIWAPLTVKCIGNTFTLAHCDAVR